MLVLHWISLPSCKNEPRLIFNKPYRAHTEPLLKQAQILKVKDLYQMRILLFSHSYKNHRLPASFNHCFDRVNTSRSTRLEHDLYYKKSRTQFSSLTTVHQAVSLWNKLPGVLKLMQSKYIFTKTVKHMLNNAYSNSVNCTNPRCRQCNNV